MVSKKRSLDQYLLEAYTQFVAIKDDDFSKAKEVFNVVFEQVKLKMGEQCNYFKKYSSQITYAGSVYDGIKVSKMDEFDMDIVIRLPINYDQTENGIIIENEEPGFVKLKIMNAFDHLDKQQDWEKCHKVTRDWRDTDKYFLQNKFRHWLHGIVQKALNAMGGTVTVFDDAYLLTYKESGPAYTLNIKNDKDDKEFTLDVDLVPVIRFMFPRSPDGYRVIKDAKAKNWYVVPKPNKELKDKVLKNRCWRLSFQEQERELIKGCKALKMTIRLLKKLRDSLAMKAIASYYIKTLFLWKREETKDDKTFWQKKLSELFRIMVQELHDAIKEKNIRFFWNEHHNLIGTLKPTLQKLYVDKLKDVLDNIVANNADKVIGLLLTTDEWREFKNSDFYQKQAAPSPEGLSHSSSAIDTTKVESLLSEEIKSISDGLRGTKVSDETFTDLEYKINNLAERLERVEDIISSGILERLERLDDKCSDIDERLKRLEMETAKTHVVNKTIDLALGDNFEQLPSNIDPF